MIDLTRWVPDPRTFHDDDQPEPPTRWFAIFDDRRSVVIEAGTTAADALATHLQGMTQHQGTVARLNYRHGELVAEWRHHPQALDFVLRLPVGVGDATNPVYWCGDLTDDEIRQFQAAESYAEAIDAYLTALVKPSRDQLAAAWDDGDAAVDRWCARLDLELQDAAVAEVGF